MPFPKPAKKPKPGVLIKEVDDLLSDIVIARDKYCITCGATSNLTCSHWIPRAHRGVRWSLINCNCQCKFCNEDHSNNVWDDGISPYTSWMFRHYGKEALHDLLDHQDELTKASRIQEIYEELKIVAKSMNIAC